MATFSLQPPCARPLQAQDDVRLSVVTETRVDGACSRFALTAAASARRLSLYHDDRRAVDYCHRVLTRETRGTMAERAITDTHLPNAFPRGAHTAGRCELEQNVMSTEMRTPAARYTASCSLACEVFNNSWCLIIPGLDPSGRAPVCPELRRHARDTPHTPPADV
ncbi:hypothetical protein E1301_Tti019399 [Triplophysa tibetana]|uniref:Uncharacterized protein n=1 Tax=Triplophysa tibetana TaxID=1572043 RepID=A0A5A9NEW9_9TELE|nr:hypothetical protein E1301_Tti019399 [Triplophysa tibetana]